jgi:2-polyprenyl-3-methyl-5-hydroxy-6-metoxy-1,4-benzoquinol methylase
MRAVVIEQAGGSTRVEDLGGDRRRISVEMPDGRRYGCETAYPTELIESILAVKGPAHLCDEITRDEDPHYVERLLTYTILSYVDESALAGKRLLDLGCGSGSSTLVLARMFPQTEIVGVELVREHVELARRRAGFYGSDNITFEQSPDGNSLPPGVGDFDFIVLSAVYEHLLPDERQTLLPLLWEHLRPRGILFIDQLPYRWSPMEKHTTGLPLLNYLPDRWVHALATRYGREAGRPLSWEDLLRKGIRGGAPSQILATLDAAGGDAELLEPARLGLADRIDLWHAVSSGTRWPAIKTGLKGALKLIKRTSGATVVPYVSLAIARAGPAGNGRRA